jgi:HlyD family secretion protein
MKGRPPRRIFVGSLGFGLPVLAIIAIGFSILSVLEGRPARKIMAPSIAAPESPFQNRVAGLGVVEPQSETISIATQLGGVVREVYVIDGDRVVGGQPLFALDSQDYKAGLADAEATVEARQAALDKIERLIESQQAVIVEQQAKLMGAQAQHKLAQATRDRDAVLLRAQLVPQQLFDSVAANEQVAQAAVYAATASLRAVQRYSDVLGAERIEASADLRASRAARDRAAIMLDESIVRAPIQSTILKVNVHRGEYAQPGVLTTPLMTLGAIDELHVRVEVDQEDAWRITAGALAVAMVRGNPNLHTYLKFVRFEPAIVPKHYLSDTDDRVDTRVLEVIYSFEPSRLNARVGQQLDVFIAVPPVPNEGSHKQPLSLNVQIPLR